MKLRGAEETVFDSMQDGASVVRVDESNGSYAHPKR